MITSIAPISACSDKTVRRRRLTPLVALVFGALLSTACQPVPLTKGQVRRATRLAVGDDRLDRFLEMNPYDIVDVRRPTTTTGFGAQDEAVVTIELRQPVPLESWPLDSCDIGRPSPEVTGVVWLIDLERREPSDVSARWGDVDCIDT